MLFNKKNYTLQIYKYKGYTKITIQAYYLTETDNTDLNSHEARLEINEGKTRKFRIQAQIRSAWLQWFKNCRNVSSPNAIDRQTKYIIESEVTQQYNRQAFLL